MVMTKTITKIIKIIVLIAILLTASIIMIGRGWLGNHEGPGTITNNQIPKQTIENRTETQKISSIKIGKNEPKQILFGDLHVHTTYSFDGYAFGTLATPYDAYRFATGEAIANPAGFKMQLSRPMDFYAVTDHGMFLGLVKAAADTTTELSKNEFSGNEPSKNW